MTDASHRLSLDETPPASAVFVDAENMAVDRERGIIDFDVDRVMAKINEMSRPVVRRAYADWFKLRSLRAPFLRSGFDQVQTTYINRSKNGLDMQLAVDAMETVLLNPSIRVVFLVTADSDFSALARGMRRHNRIVIAIGWREKTNQIFRNNCDHFLHYDDLPKVAVDEERPDRPVAPPREIAEEGPQPRRGRPEPGGDRRDRRVRPERSERADRPQRPQATRNLAELNPAIARLLLENGPGVALGIRALIAALRAGVSSLDPGAFGLRTFAQLIESHPLLTRDPRTVGPNAAVLLPRRIDLRAILPTPPVTVEAAEARLSEPAIGFLGRDRQYQLLRHLHRAYLTGEHEPFTRRDLLADVAEKLEDVTPEDAEKIDRLIWRAKLFQVVDRAGRDPMMWQVRLKEEYADFDAFQFQHDKQLVAEGMLAGVVLNARGWALVLDGDEQDAADFADILLDLGFDDPDFAAEDEDDEEGAEAAESAAAPASDRPRPNGDGAVADEPAPVAEPYLADEREDVEFGLGEPDGEDALPEPEPEAEPEDEAAPEALPAVAEVYGHVLERPHHVEVSPRMKRTYDA